jgi:hypothetical protein
VGAAGSTGSGTSTDTGIRQKLADGFQGLLVDAGTNAGTGAGSTGPGLAGGTGQ